MCKIENFDEFYWIDVYEGQIGCSDGAGNVALVNSEGEVVWKKKGGYGGWLCRLDESGVYHGHTKGVDKYDYKVRSLFDVGCL